MADSQYGIFSSTTDRSREVSFFRDTHITNGRDLYLHKTNDHKHWAAITSRRIDLLATNQAATGGVITLRSPDFKKSYNSF